MNRTLLTLATGLLCIGLYAQTGPAYGIKGGLNYNSNGDYFESAQSVAQNPDKNVGYHLGVWGKLGNDIYLRPELVFTRTKSGYDDGDFKMSKLDLPVLAGIRIIGPLHVFAGPAFQYILDTEFDGIKIDDVNNDFTVGLNLGVGVNLGSLGLEVRYERGFSENEARFINTNLTDGLEDRIDTRPSQLILSLSIAL
jgi:hypothetical protein